MQEEGDSLGEFHVLGLLGQGGSGTVHDAEWGGRPVALKVLRDELVPTARARERFLAEAKLLAAVDHPGVVKVLGAGTLPNGRPYVAMERLTGECLARRLDRGALPLEEAMVCFEQLAAAASALHERGLIHRDIKPENVILTDRGAVLLDLGIARPEHASPSTSTQDGTVRGTPAYMAPERFFGAPASVATDIYELTVVLYMLTTGRLPWTDYTDPSSRLNLPRPSEIGCPLPAALETELLAGLSTRAEARPKTVAELALRVRRALAQDGDGERRHTEELPAEPQPRGAAGRELAPTLPSLPPHGPVFPRGERAVLWIAAVLLIVGLGAAAILFAGRTGAAPEATALAPAPVDVPAPAPAPAPAPTTTAPIPPPPISPPPPAAPRAELSPAVKELLALHPANTEVVVSGSPQQLRDSAFVKSALAAPEGVAMLGFLERQGAHCSPDLLTSVEAFAVGLGVDGESEIDLSARGDFARERVEACLGDLIKAGLRAVEVKQADRTTSLANGTDTLWLAWPDARTVFASLRPTIDRAWLDARVAGTDSVRGQDELMTLLDRVDTGATLWVVAAPERGGGTLIPGGDPPLGMHVSVVLTHEIALRAGLRYASAAQAETNAPLLQAQLTTLKQNPFGMMMFKDASVAVAGDEVAFAMTMDETTAMLTQQALLQMTQPTQ